MALTRSQIVTLAPASGALEPSQSVSSKYRFLNTMDVVDRMGELGWGVAEATQSAQGEFGIHTLAFESAEMAGLFPSTYGIVPRINFMNAHTGKFAARSYRAIHRQVCSNGLVAMSRVGNVGKTAHVGSVVDKVNLMITDYLDSIKEVTGRVVEAGNMPIHHKTAIAFANKAVALRGLNPDTVDHKEILAVRRDADGEATLWNVFNRVQESVVRGGFIINLKNGDKPYGLVASAIESPVKLAKINMGLWSMMEEVLDKQTN